MRCAARGWRTPRAAGADGFAVGPWARGDLRAVVAGRAVPRAPGKRALRALSVPGLLHGCHHLGSVGESGVRDRLGSAWVSMPDLAVRPSRQTSTHLRPGRVRFSSGDFRSDLEFDEEGFVVDYPRLAGRLTAR
ncbi:putative glycolipid-binding domain-containing protein [Streptomyces sp. NPDC059696]|uniref:putative glycolipid-binding domain-containing protein n=1 Tax=Streptomyces sp. NPDC059696 TaxID=3346911 RepID=UPI00367571F7